MEDTAKKDNPSKNDLIKMVLILRIIVRIEIKTK
ncbi:hypothetical protein FIC_00911 [Flavobacteriaceae bacterium 3519-10]|nr:hypothetical protein FIC_00911 [Flavobacteriaceae bacterium 3519-10]